MTPFSHTHQLRTTTTKQRDLCHLRMLRARLSSVVCFTRFNREICPLTKAPFSSGDPRAGCFQLAWYYSKAAVHCPCRICAPPRSRDGVPHAAPRMHCAAQGSGIPCSWLWCLPPSRCGPAPLCCLHAAPPRDMHGAEQRRCLQRPPPCAARRPALGGLLTQRRARVARRGAAPPAAACGASTLLRFAPHLAQGFTWCQRNLSLPAINKRVLCK